MALHDTLGVLLAQNGNRFATGVLAPSAADEDVATGLATVIRGGAELIEAPALTHLQSIATPSTAAGSLRIRSYKPTGAGNTTPTAATGTLKAVMWWAVGT